ncbi:MAG: beta-xylosidase, partial [Firmicutes bacterium]|nr:beta-xylosidase [Bacillota bacterium]
LEINHLPNHGKVAIRHYRIDRSHSNAYTEWVRQGRPNFPTPQQYAAIKSKDQLEFLEPPQEVSLSNSTLVMEFQLPTHAVSWIEVQPGT